MGKINIVFFCSWAFLSFSACGGENTVHWRQEVQLQDGRVIEVSRVSKLSGKMLPENSILELEQTMEFVNPDSSEKLSWNAPKGLAPNLLDFENGVPYLVARPSSVADYNTWECPNPPFVTYWWKQGRWQRISLEQVPKRFQVPNLFLGATTDKNAVSDGVVTIEEMQKSIKESAKQFKTISREKISAMAKGCNPDTLTKLGRQSEINYGR